MTTITNVEKVQWRCGPLGERLSFRASAWGVRADEASRRLVAMAEYGVAPELHAQVVELSMAWPGELHGFSRACAYAGAVLEQSELEYGPMPLSQQRNVIRGLADGIRKSTSKGRRNGKT